MGRREKGEEREGKRKEEGLMERKLRSGFLLAERGGTCTTPPPKWRLNDKDNNKKPPKEFLSFEKPSPIVSARKLCANLWEIESHKNPVAEMAKGGLRARRRARKSNGFNGFPKNLTNLSELNRQDQLEAIQHRRSVERNDHYRAIEAVSHPSYGGSSMELVATRSSSLDLKFRMLRPSYSLEPSSELMKVMNRIWSLEEQNASNASLVRALRAELDRARGRINELAKESLKQDRLRAAVQSVRDGLEGERRRSEGLNRRLARDLSKLKSSLANALRELERERKARVLLENLCDEFAKGISEYENELRSIKHRLEREQRTGPDRPERLILHISEAWLDERTQMKLSEPENNVAEKITIVDKLGFDIATFLRAKHEVEPKPRRFSLESFALNEAASAPRNPAEDESTDFDFEEEKGATKPVSGSVLTGNASPIQPWNSKSARPGFGEPECCSRWPRELDENTLMAQLIEARLEKRRRSRSKPLKD